MKTKQFKYLILLTCISCSLSIYQETDKLVHQLFVKLGKPLHKESFILIVQTNLGCSTCNDLVTEFIKHNNNNNKLHFVITGLPNKEMNIKYTPQLLKSNTVIIDKNRDAIKLGLVFEPSLILHINEGSVEDRVELTPDNIDGELDRLRNELALW